MAKNKNLSMSSHVIFVNSQGAQAQGSLVRLSRQMVVFEVYNPYSIVQLSEVLSELRIQQGDRQTYQGRAVITSLLNTGLMLIVSASLVDPWSDLKDLQPGPVLRSYVHDFVADWEAATARLEKPYQLGVTNLRNYLQELSRWLEHWETEAGGQDRLQRSGRMEEFVRDVDQEIEPRLTTLYGEFEEAAHGIDRKYVPYHRAFAQRELHPLMMSSPFMNRAFNKPLGYAGDFEMVRMMLSSPYEGGNTFSKLLNASALRHEAPAAHRNRIDLLEKALRRETYRALASRYAPNDASSDTDPSPGEIESGNAGPGDTGPASGVAADDERIKIMNLGCGPAVEVMKFAQADSVSAHVNFDLIDFNTETLRHVAENLIPDARAIRPEMVIQTEQRSVHEIIQLSVEGGEKSKSPKPRPQYDMVYCAGLFDYFRDTTCGFLIDLFYSWTKPGGLVLVTNVSPSHSSRAIMGMILDWNLELRDEAGMRSLAPTLGEQKTYVDQTGVNVFLEIRKPIASVG